MTRVGSQRHSKEEQVIKFFYKCYFHKVKRTIHGHSRLMTLLTKLQ
jgi:hypothetical protein